MVRQTIEIYVNEKKELVKPEMTMGDLRDWIKPDADVLVINGHTVSPEEKVKEGDRVLLIRKGEIPEHDELVALLASRHTPEVQKRMEEATIGIAGLGGLGSAVAIALARMGIGQLIIVDFDFVEPNNVHRQQYRIEHIGMPKVDAMINIISSVNPYVRVVSHKVFLKQDNIPVIFGSADVVIECFDQPEAKAMLIQTVAELLPDTYVIGASGIAGYGNNNSVSTHRLGEKIYIVGDLVSEVKPGQPLMAGRVGIAAHHQANLVVSLLMGKDDEGVED